MSPSSCGLAFRDSEIQCASYLLEKFIISTNVQAWSNRQGQCSSVSKLALTFVLLPLHSPATSGHMGKTGLRDLVSKQRKLHKLSPLSPRHMLTLSMSFSNTAFAANYSNRQPTRSPASSACQVGSNTLLGPAEVFSDCPVPSIAVTP